MQIVELDAAGLTLTKIAAQTGASTATVRVALGRVAAVSATVDEPVMEPLPAGDSTNDDLASTHDEVPDGQASALVVLVAPVPRTAERVAARFGQLAEAPGVITQGARLPLAGLLPVAGDVYGPMRKGLSGLRATLLMGVFLALLREPRAEGATRIRPADLGRLLGLDRAPGGQDAAPQTR